MRTGRERGGPTINRSQEMGKDFLMMLWVSHGVSLEDSQYVWTSICLRNLTPNTAEPLASAVPLNAVNLFLFV